MHDGLKDALAQNGWAMRQPGFLQFDLGGAACEFEHIYALKAADSGYENVAQLHESDIAALPAIKSIFEQVRRHMAAISPSLAFAQLWLVKSREENIHADVVPFVPHFDRQRFIKAMIYLDDVLPADGPFTVASQPRLAPTACAGFYPTTDKARGMNVVRDVPVAHFTACTGPAGSVIFFDTNSPHYAAHVQASGQRRVFRFDFTNPAWNWPSLRTRLARAVLAALPRNRLVGLASHMIREA